MLAKNMVDRIFLSFSCFDIIELVKPKFANMWKKFITRLQMLTKPNIEGSKTFAITANWAKPNTVVMIVAAVVHFAPLMAAFWLLI